MEGLACADPKARTPIGISRNFLQIVTDSVKKFKSTFLWKPKLGSIFKSTNKQVMLLNIV